MARGLFIALDGMDGSGKATQAKLLAERVKKTRNVFSIDFPQYGKKSAGPIEEYLKGSYGLAGNVRPDVASYFYAIDRFDASFAIRAALERGDIVIADRYTAANIGHQGGKFADNEEQWKRYVDWLHGLEYGVFSIPEPDLYFIFLIPPEVSGSNSGKAVDPEKIKKLSYLGNEKQDILERDTSHLKGAFASYSLLLKEYPDKFTRVECAPSGTFRTPSDIHEEIWKKVEPLLK